MEAVGCGIVSLILKLPSGQLKRCRLENVLHVPDLSYNLISVSKVSEAGKMMKFDESGCQILNKVIATATRCGSLYFMNCKSNEQANAAETKEDVWHNGVDI